MVINSLNNDIIKYAVSLKVKKIRDIENKFLIEGNHLISMASNIECIFVVNQDYKSKYKTYYVASAVMDKLSFNKSSPGIMAIVSKEKHALNNDEKKILLLDNLNDPGNVGTIIRSAMAFGIDAIILSPNSVDVYNDKVIRASQGGIFKIKIIYSNIMDSLIEFKKKNIPSYAACLASSSIDIKTIKKQESFALVLGNEAHGISIDAINKCDYKIIINHNKDMDSLNVGIAAAIILYQLT